MIYDRQIENSQCDSSRLKSQHLRDRGEIIKIIFIIFNNIDRGEIIKIIKSSRPASDTAAW